MFKLVIQDDEGKTTVVPLVRDEITIGRKEGNTIRLTERNVSRKHARLVRQGTSVELEDLASYNGVRVNGMRIVEKVALAVSDRVQIGDYLIELKSDVLVTGSANDGAPTQQMHALGGALGTSATAPVTAVRPPDEALAADSSQFVRDELDTAETIPVAARPTAQFARLVVLSTQFAGEEHPLNQVQAVIGRGDESDIYVDHQSLSRNHARIVRELDTGNYFIEDLNSANGVRINGAEQQRARLRRGDVIDLGDLKLRFVEADEEFSFSPDLTMPEATEARASRKTPWLILGAVLLAGVVGWKLVSREKTVASEHHVAVDAPPPPVVVDARVPDAPSVDAPAVPEPATVTPTSQFLAAASEGRFADAFVIHKRHAREAGFAAATAASFAELERNYSASVVTETKALVAAKQCSKIEGVAREAEKNLASAGAAVRALGAGCKEAGTEVAVAPAIPAKKPPQPEKPEPVKVVAPADDPKPVAVTPTPVAKDGEPKTAADALTIAREAAFNGFHAKAARYASTALQFDSGNVDALQILVLSNCKMGKADAAKRYAAKLPASSQSAVRQVCLSQGISLD